MLATMMNQFFDVVGELCHAAGSWILDLAPLVGIFAVQSGLWLLPGIVLLVAAKFFILAPVRRRETAHAFLDLLEMGLAQGRSPENTIVEIAATGDKTLGKGV